MIYLNKRQFKHYSVEVARFSFTPQNQTSFFATIDIPYNTIKIPELFINVRKTISIWVYRDSILNLIEYVTSSAENIYNK